VQVENNVTYNTVGHCFFLEDGIKTGNQYVRNPGIMTKCHPTLPCVPSNLAAEGSRSGAGANGQSSKDVLIPSDNTVSTLLHAITSSAILAPSTMRRIPSPASVQPADGARAFEWNVGVEAQRQGFALAAIPLRY
jgi:hypothetical protein